MTALEAIAQIETQIASLIEYTTKKKAEATEAHDHGAAALRQLQIGDFQQCLDTVQFYKTRITT